MSPSGQAVYMRTVPGNWKLRVLTQPLKCKMWDGTTHDIPSGFTWDGSSTPTILLPLFPKHRHPLASCKHDYRCGKAKNDKERKWSDGKFEKDVGRTSWKITAKMGYLGVRVGAFFGVGSNF